MKIKSPSSQLSVMDAINIRCSVRHYTPDKLDRDMIQRLLDAAVRAPTAMHSEPWAFVVVQDADLLRQISDVAKDIVMQKGLPETDSTRRLLEMVRQPDFNIFYDAGSLVVIGADLASQFATADCWLAAENLMLAALSLGLGTCVISFALDALNAPEWKTRLGIPAEITAVAPIIVGVPAAVTAVSPRKPPHVLAWK